MITTDRGNDEKVEPSGKYEYLTTEHSLKWHSHVVLHQGHGSVHINIHTYIRMYKGSVA